MPRLSKPAADQFRGGRHHQIDLQDDSGIPAFMHQHLPGNCVEDWGYIAERDLQN